MDWSRVRALGISVFVCALGHFEWLRMPFGLKNAPMIYQRMIDNDDPLTSLTSANGVLVALVDGFVVVTGFTATLRCYDVAVVEEESAS
ncbi:Hypothetical protein PHPALM_3042 [Phytophthora palmivora]|uniref:Uncharacterized protein n=1 Tax=Phytophthora palmivora TaxID=4796 RepID=A0A2P4YNG9_9STRA|nr:Hypothetical protein PHPALM_3042 [Phytophthora palmivora]